MVDATRHLWIAPIALLLLTTGLAILWASAFLVTHWLSWNDISRAIGLVATITTAELIREHLFTGFPWALPGYVWSETHLIQIISIVGPHGLTLLTLLICVLPIGLANKYFGLSLAAILLISLQLFGIYRIPNLSNSDTDQPIVRLVQPNIAQEDKWNTELQWVFFSQLIQLSRLEAQVEPDLIIWPETAITSFLLSDSNRHFVGLSDAVGNVPLITGIRRFENGNIYNSLLYLTQEGEIAGVHDKHHLVPFGEYIPMAAILSTIFGIDALTADRLGGFSKGAHPVLMSVKSIGKILPLICYEAIFPNEVRKVGRPDVLIHITNDAWFGNNAGPLQHFQHSRMRAIELGLPMVRVANTGISGIIDSYGRISSVLPLITTGSVDAHLPEKLESTIYSRTGDLPLHVILILTFVGLWLRRTQAMH